MKSSTKPKRSKRVGKWKFCQHSLTFFWRIQKKIFWRMLVTKPFFFLNIFLYIPQKKVRCWEGWGWVNYDRIFIFVWLVFNLQTCQITNMMHAWWKDPFIYFMLTWRWFSWWGWFSILNWTLEGTSYTRFFQQPLHYSDHLMCCLLCNPENSWKLIFPAPFSFYSTPLNLKGPMFFSIATA